MRSNITNIYCVAINFFPFINLLPIFIKNLFVLKINFINQMYNYFELFTRASKLVHMAMVNNFVVTQYL